MKNPPFHFHGQGIGEQLSLSRLVVPPNQRAYAWGEAQVADLLNDLDSAMRQRDGQDYFLGTIVLVETGDGLPQIADGQQRLATTTILLARIRDLLKEIGRGMAAQSVEQTYIAEIDLRSEEVIPKLRLNNEDDTFFREHILRDLSEASAKVAAQAAATAPSNKRLLDASETISAFIRDLVADRSPADQFDLLSDWIEFLKDRASVGVVTVPDEAGAFRMFETLNDRGLKASQADILKNYLLSKATKAKFSLLHTRWSEMNGAISTLPANEDDNLVDYIRYFWISRNGLTRQRELADSIKANVKSSSEVEKFVTEARDRAGDFVALWQPHHSKWNNYRSGTRRHLRTLFDDLKVEQILPLMFAISAYFTPEEGEKAFKLCVSWSVRFLIAGQGKAGRLDKPYSDRAHDIGSGKIKTARELREAMKPIVPTDREFAEAFANARVSKSYLARYYLRTIEQTLWEEANPERVANDDAEQVNLEHIIPLRPGPAWELDRETIEAAQKLLGNMVLLQADKNVALGNASFEQKRSVFAQSDFVLTSNVAALDRFGLEQIKERQKAMSAVAVKAWSTAFL